MSEPAPSSDLRICVEAEAMVEDVGWLNQRLADYTVHIIGRNDFAPVSIFLRDKSSQLFGGLVGYSIWSTMQIDSLWVEESLRHLGYGKALLAAAEQLARNRGCKLIQLETYSTVALQFYQHFGFVVFGRLRISDSLSRYYLSKSLQNDGSFFSS